MADLTLSHVGKVYADGTRAVTDLSIDIGDGEFMVFVGPSGCGKTTALRMVAGLESITEGEVRIGDRVVNNLPPRDRDVAMVFQSYALYPHMTVRDNIGFSLGLRKMAKAEINRRVEHAADLLGLTEHLDRKPRNLSGGQRQRVAMGRVIVRQPQAFLMDEPLSNLDAKLRVQMRAEIGRLQRDLEVTTIYVTHDQTEAMTLGDRVAVLRGGVLQQLAPPQVLYDRPANLFVAGFIGSPAMNALEGVLERDDDRYLIRLGTQWLNIPPQVTHERPGLAARVGQPTIVGIRPENLQEASTAGQADGTSLTAVVELVEPLGADVMVHLSAGVPRPQDRADLAEAVGEPGEVVASVQDETPMVARFTARSSVAVGDRVSVAVDTERLHFFDPHTGMAVWKD
ncbi:MAG TPA: sn-glycerol-3-phosphate ABC transporter ATP-binding protein UgpC [Mycobacteriales bacterium]|nr:sn-glycerol-3-phosphate ABC transporter ATP-binding protein UgpC [Mycobacteriales bacterium]